MAISSQDDWQLLKQFYAGDAAAFRALYDKYKQKVLHLALRLLRDQTFAEEIVQDVFLKIYDKKVRWNRHAQFFTWLYRVTFNAAIDKRRRQKSLNAIELSLDEATPDSMSYSEVAIEEEDRRHAVEQAIDQLPEPLRLPILLYQFEGMAYADIAQVLGISKKAVERRLAHAKAQLRNQLKKYL